MFVKRIFIAISLFPAFALAQQSGELMLPSMAGYLKSDIVIKRSPGVNANSYDLALLANKRLIEAKTKYVFESTKTKVLNSTLTYGTNLIARYIPLTSITPTKTILDFTASEWIKQYQDKDLKQFQGTIEKTFTAYTNAYLADKPDASMADLSRHFSIFVKSDLVNAESYPVIGKKLDAFVLDYINANEQRFKDLQSSVKSSISGRQALDLKLEEKLAKIKTELKTEMQGSVSNIERKQWDKLNSYQKSFEKLQDNILGNYKDVYKDMDNMKREVSQNKKEIEENTGAILLLTKKAKTIETDVAALNGNNRLLKAKMAETRLLVDENNYKTTVIADVLYNNVDVKGKIELLKKGTITVKDQATELKRLERISKIDDAERYFAIAGQSVELASNLGLNPTDAKNMSTIIKGLDVTAKLAKAYLTGDPLSGLEGVNMAFSMFKSAPPNPEFEATMHQFAVVNEKLDKIDTKIDSLSSKLSKMMNVQIAMHEENMAELTKMQELQIIMDKKIDYQIQLFTSNALTGVTDELLRKLKNRADTCKTLDCLGKGGIDTKYKILEAIYDATGDSVIRSKPFLHYMATKDGIDVQLKLFEPLLEIININRGSGKDYSQTLLPSLLLLPVNCGGADDIYNEFNSKPRSARITISKEEITRLLQPKEISRLSELLLQLEPFMYYGDPFNGLKTYTFADFSKNVDISDKNYSSKLRFKNLLFFCDVAIIQQNILNGGPNLQLFSQFLTQGMPLDEQSKRAVFSCLNEKTNYYFQSNLATYILHNAIGERQTIFNLFKDLYAGSFNLDANDDRLKRLNNFLHIVNGEITLNTHHKLTLRMTMPGQSAFELPVQLPQTIMDNLMIYPPDVYDLYNTRVKLSNKLIEYDFIESIRGEKALNNLLYSNIFNNPETKNN